MAAKRVVLFDLPTQGKSHCWSLNPWKARLCLNYKEVPYETRWTEYPDIAQLFESFGIPPNLEGSAAYTIPAVQMTDGRYIMDSVKIAEALDAEYPTPSLHLHSPRVERTQEALQLVNDALARITRSRVPEKVALNPSSAEYFRRTRAKRFGMPWEDIPLKDPGAVDEAWENAAEGMKLLRNVIAKDTDGPYIMGREPGFADFILAGFWRFVQILDENGDLYGRLMKYDLSFAKHFAACEYLLERDD